jgi:hypothetical protein
MDLGKRATHHFAAACSFYPMLRRVGHEGIAIFALSADRAVLAPLDRLLRQRQAGFYAPGVGLELGPQRPLLEATDWHVACGCAAHDSANAFRWALRSRFPAEASWDLHSVVDGVRHAFGDLLTQLSQWVGGRLAPHPSAVSAEEAQAFWTTLGVDAVMVESVAAVNPWFRDGTLFVSAEVLAQNNCLEEISAVVLYLLRLRRHTESRWMSVGLAARGLLGALAVGLGDMVAQLRATPGVSDMFLRNWERMSPDVAEFSVHASMVGFIADSLLVEVQEDDRLLSRREELMESVYEELQWIAGLADYVWDRYAALVGGKCEARLLRASVLRCGHVALSYIFFKVFRPMLGHPWSLAVGDIEANMSQLLAAEAASVADPLARKLRALLAQGYNRTLLVDALTLLRSVPWSSVAVEQAHGSIALIHRMHPRLGTKTMCTRAMLHQIRALHHVSSEERARQGLEKKRAALVRRRPERVGSRHAVVQALFQARAAEGSPAHAAQRTELLSRAGSFMQALSPAQQQELADRARRGGEVRRRELEEELEHVDSQLALLRRRSSASQGSQGSVRADGQRLAEEDYQRIQQLLDGANFGRAQVQSLRERALMPPAAPTREHLDILQGVLPEAAGPRAARGPWLAHVARNREQLGSAIFLSGEADGCDAFWLSYATQQPLSAYFLRLRLTDAVLPSAQGATVAEVLAMGDNWWPWRFIAQGAWSYVSDEEVSFQEGNVLVLLEPHFLSATEIVAAGPPRRLQDILGDPPAPVARVPAAARQPRPTEDVVQAELAARPWLQDLIGARPPKAPPAAAKAPPAAPPEEAEADEAAEEVAPPDVVAVGEELRLLREELGATAGADPFHDFYICVRGGAWTLENKGVAGDTCVGQARKGQPTEWARRYGLNVQASFAFSRYGREAAARLATEWCLRMQHFYDVWCAAGHQHVYTATELDSYAPDQA